MAFPASLKLKDGIPVIRIVRIECWFHKEENCISGECSGRVMKDHTLEIVVSEEVFGKTNPQAINMHVDDCLTIC